MKRRNIIGLCIIGTLLLGGLILEVRHVGGFPLRDSLPIEHPHYTASLDSLISHLYGVISGEAGKKRNWDEFRSLFYPSAHLRAAIADTSRGKTGAVLRNMSPEEYIATAGKQLEARGFFEREIHRVTEQFGHVAFEINRCQSSKSCAAGKSGLYNESEPRRDFLIITDGCAMGFLTSMATSISS